MTLRTALALVLLMAVAGCGVKSDLTPPDNKPAPKGQQDPSKPPSPIGR
jgi:predicted small lipoprotein YifL